MKQKAPCTIGQAQSYGPHQQTEGLGGILSPVSLRCHATGTHAQKAKYPIDDVEQQSPHGYSTYVSRTTQMPHDGHIYQSQQGHSNITYYGGQGNAKNLSVDRFHDTASLRGDTALP